MLNSITKAFCTTIVLTSGFSQTASADTLESIKGFTMGSKGVTYQVASGGCTAKEDFDVIVNLSFPPKVKLLRVNPDTCVMYKPLGTSIEFSYKELGLGYGAEFIMGNPISTLITPN